LVTGGIELAQGGGSGVAGFSHKDRGMSRWFDEWEGGVRRRES